MKIVKVKHRWPDPHHIMQELWDTVKWVFAIAAENDLSVYAGNATLYIVIAAFPFLVLAISLINILPNAGFDQLTGLILEMLPQVSEIQSLVLYILESLRTRSFGFLAGAAALVSLWFASGGITAVQKGLKRITLHADNSLLDKPIALLYTVIFLLLFPCLLVFQLFGTSIENIIVFLAARHNYIEAAVKIVDMMEVSGIVTALMTAVILTLTFTYLPGGRRPFHQQLPGGILTAVIWIVFSRLFSVFIPILYSRNSIYGSLTALFLTLLWLRILMFIMFLGASVNTVLRLKAEQTKP